MNETIQTDRASAGETLHAKTDQLRESRQAWVEGVRSTVCSNPLKTAMTPTAMFITALILLPAVGLVIWA